MILRLFFALLLAFSSRCPAQELLMDTEDVHSADQIEARFQGGTIYDFYSFVHKTMDKSKITKPGKMTASFVIDESGELTQIRIVEMIDVASAQEFIRVLKSSPRWTAAKNAGKPVSVTIRMPLIFNK